jgi:hypothetical protein
MWQVGRATDEEGLRMMLAFFGIDDPRQRLRLIELAEAIAKGSVPLDGDVSLALQDNGPDSATRHPPTR